MINVDWLAESIRFTFFHNGPGLWKPFFQDLTGSPPEELTERAAQQIRQEIGTFLGYKLTVGQMRGRADIVFADDPQSNLFDPSKPNFKKFYSVGSYKTAKSELQKLVEPFLAQLVGVIRVAFNPIVIVPENDILTANRDLTKCLPNVQFDPETCSEIFWQINRARPSKSYPGNVNRIGKWQVLQQKMLEIPLIAGGMPNPNAVERVCVRAELDLSTSQENVGVFESTTVAGIFAELIGFADEILAEGDVA